MFIYISRRLASIIPTALGVVVLTFLLLHLTPGDPVEALLGEYAPSADRAALSAALGLDQPLHIQFWHFLTQVLSGDLGVSFRSREPVLQLILSRLPATAVLAFGAMAFALLVAIPLGVWAGANKNRWPDKLATGYALSGLAMPSFWMGPLLIIVFALWFKLLPVSGFESPLSLVLPSVTLGMAMSAMTTRLLRTSMLEVMHADFMRTAMAKGVGRRSLLFKHAFRNALLPLVTVVFLQAGALLTGAILTEAVFSWPGLGSLLIQGIEQRDYPLVQGCVLFIAFVYMLMTLCADIAYAWIDPRVRYGGVGK